ncbi:MAG: BTAD domain-containing putative transcriptional regulator [Caldilineaceae bacterium]
MPVNPLQIQLLGGFQLYWQGEVAPGFANTRLQSTLAYLLLHHTAPQSRQSLAYLFWPESSESQARTNLRNILHLLRNHLPQADSYLLGDSRVIQWAPDAPATVDVLEFAAQLQAAEQASDTHARQQALEAALALYRGDLLPDCYDDWLLPLRDEWRHRYLSALQQLIGLLQQQRNYAGAITQAQSLLQLDPLQESVYATLMELYAAQGDRAAALRIYHLCQTTLIRELGVEPSPTTQATYERLLNLDKVAAGPEVMRPTAPLVGRSTAWQALQAAWQCTAHKPATLVIVEGEAGIGKTRLVEELAEWARRQGVATAVAPCYPAAARLAFAPLQSWLRSPSFKTPLTQLAPAWQQELGRLLPELAVSQPTYAAPPLSETAQRRRLFEALNQVIIQHSAPLLLILDDIQWCDEDSLEWLEYLLQSGAGRNLLLVATERSGEITADHPLTAFRLRLLRLDQLQTIPLHRLTLQETAELVTQLRGQRPAATEMNHIFADTEGNPLFVVEMVRANDQRVRYQQASGKEQGQMSTGPLPAKLQSILEARLVRLSPAARALADVAAVVGRAFTLGLLLQVAASDEETLVQGLDELWRQQIIREHQLGVAASDDAYDFTHDKLREVVYATISPMRRRLLHRQVATALEVQHHDRLDEVSSQLAMHYERAGQIMAACRWRHRAAQVAHSLAALQDALTHLAHAVELLTSVPAHAERDQLELAVQMERGALLLATKGYAAPAVEQALQRAWALCEQSGDAHQLFHVLWGLGRYYFVKPELARGLALCRQLETLAIELNDDALRVEAYASIGTYLFHQAEFAAALRYFEQALALYDQQQHGDHTLVYGQDPGVVSLAYGAWACWCLGEQAKAEAKTQQALELALALGHPYNLAIAQTYASVQEQFKGKAASCLALATKASALTTEYGFILWQAMADFLRGWSTLQLGQAEEGMTLMAASAELFRGTGAELGAAYFAALLAETLGAIGQPEFGIIAMHEAFDLLERTQDRWCAAELYRIRGALLLQLPEQTAETRAQAQAAFEQALTIASEQQARWWEVRAQASLQASGHFKQ